PTARSLPFGETFIPVGIAGTGVLAAWVREPSEPTLKVTTVRFELIPANKNVASGEAASEMSPKPEVEPAENGEFGTGVKKPVFGSMENALISCVPPFEAKRNFPPATTMRLTAYPPPP